MIEVNGNLLTINEVMRAAINFEKVHLSKKAIEQMQVSYQNVLAIIQKEEPVYGINTGFGSFADETISHKDSKRLNRNLIISHAVGTGDPLPFDVVRAAMLIRANTLSKGVSGVNPIVIKTLIEMLNAGVIPFVSSKGSLGSSGDLCMLAQLALVAYADPDKKEESLGKAFYQKKLLNGNSAMRKAKIKRVVMEYKDGLSLINGATFSAALMSLNCGNGEELCDLADIAISLSVEGLMGRSDAFHPMIHANRGMEGQIKSAANIRNLTSGSNLVDGHQHVQDAYSIRCAPQVHGAVRDAIRHTAEVITKEINAATDNPLISIDGQAISGGNFHGEPIGLVADYFKNGVSEIGAIAERRIFRMLDKDLNNGLPPMLVGRDASPGLNSGLMILQYTAAALALENQSLCSPDSIRSLPTSANQEDHNANAYTAAFHAREILKNTTKIIAIELFTACRAIHIRLLDNPGLKLGKKNKKIFGLIEQVFPYSSEDSLWREQLEVFYTLLQSDSQLKSELLSIID